MGSRGRQKKKRCPATRRRILEPELLRPERVEIAVRAADYQTSIVRRSRHGAAVVLGVAGGGLVLSILAALGVLW